MYMQRRNHLAEILAATPKGEYYLYTDMAAALAGVDPVRPAGITVDGAAVALQQPDDVAAQRDATLDFLADTVKSTPDTQLYLDFLANAATPSIAQVALSAEHRYEICVNAPASDAALCVQRLVLDVPSLVSAEAVVRVSSLSALLLQLKVNVAAGASFRLVVLQDGEADKKIFSRTTLDLAADAHADVTFVNLHPALARNEVKCGIHDKGADLRLNGLYVVGDGQQVDNETLVEHYAGHSSSSQLFKGIAHGNGRMAFGGLILVKPDAQKTAAEQTNRHMLASREARAYAKPQLEIYADDVKCSHGATTGQIDPAQLFYMQQRGIDEATARRLLAAAFVGEVVDMIPFSDIQDQLRARLTGESDAQ